MSEIENEAWVEWQGGECPVVKGTRVDVRLSDEQTLRRVEASFLDWEHGQPDLNFIVAYRVRQIEEADHA